MATIKVTGESIVWLIDALAVLCILSGFLICMNLQAATGEASNKH